jgi:hypothetical protein
VPEWAWKDVLFGNLLKESGLQAIRKTEEPLEDVPLV